MELKKQLEYHIPLLVQVHERIARNLPQEAVRIGIISAITVPERLLPGFQDPCPETSGLIKNRIDIVLAQGEIREREFPKAG